ncbi:DUF6884 domain-containing protein [Listeria costaricensis]|uniref:DUF6884 domain-containing protein n=1 Tax=Listeria costaricensis TaxID=2026604 RepID=UPI000C0780ED|nr:DUF6884 domain-containing protein [Listeria costaricensis]
MMIVPSGKPKIWDKAPEAGAVPAREAYMGTFHRLARAYAEQFAGSAGYLILSPKYGFLQPNDLVAGPYDVRFTKKGTTSATIDLKTLQYQWGKVAPSSKETVILLGGVKYGPLCRSIMGETVRIEEPLVGRGGIGFMQQALKKAVETNQPLTNRRD